MTGVKFINFRKKRNFCNTRHKQYNIFFFLIIAYLFKLETTFTLFTIGNSFHFFNIIMCFFVYTLFTNNATFRFPTTCNHSLVYTVHLSSTKCVKNLFIKPTVDCTAVQRLFHSLHRTTRTSMQYIFFFIIIIIISLNAKHVKTVAFFAFGLKTWFFS